MSALHAVDGVWLEDDEGRRLLDLHSNTAHHIGYGHPKLIAALKVQLDELPFAPRRFANAPAVALAEKLLSRWQGPPARVLFATGGSDALSPMSAIERLLLGEVAAGPDAGTLRIGCDGQAVETSVGARVADEDTSTAACPVAPAWSDAEGVHAMLLTSPLARSIRASKSHSSSICGFVRKAASLLARAKNESALSMLSLVGAAPISERARAAEKRIGAACLGEVYHSTSSPRASIVDAERPATCMASRSSGRTIACRPSFSISL
ncbi:aminotransferase class III-fold pyridoxal phosphate-dependent enzyme [Bosea sp. (in: a-proteobacteria)]|uniref:aminotransferase class III-fold pyridoxal phosphate-dependent enzyme n=1 Tax=Bosea sp. (in: a-proteobacteria) TaxID=1871050 RepID=UPI003566D864